ncbi:hypothetical protein HYPSUDRAFT_57790 [Hypholoma sublateritium FD-334 SS-4]|uniref:DUF6534 domain-containing protein n=1 Tax=Hypholoma sublateritium (strain FD-334 SS-4) TaxID=945553 RepID=A0A0D2NE73_HYPSF|nr:hypothetical protein HYPSUDRAFT_57790 [Hypholoma sublateritium FD-334 SS-4]
MSGESINLAQIAGPIKPFSNKKYLGILFNWTLYGVLVMQVYIYYAAFQKDQTTVKTLVYGLFLLDSLQSILLARDGFITFASGFGNVEGLDEAHLEWFSIPFTTAIVSCIVQCFFATRIYILSEKSYWIPGAVVMTSLVQGIAAILSGVKDLKLHLYSLLQTQAVVEITVWHVATAVCDILIAGSMSYYLYKRDTGVKRTHEVVTRLIRLTIETGTATATIATLDLILFLGAPGKIYFITPSFIAAKLYVNTVVVIFNNRAQIVTNRMSTVTTADPSTQSQNGRARTVNKLSDRIQLTTRSKHNSNSYPPGVEIQKSVSVWNDDDMHVKRVGESLTA